MQKQRDSFVDSIKIYACFLVALGHFFMSMTASDIVADSFVISWFVKTVYYFHVPLFFVCSGYLYQKYSKVYTLSPYGNFILKKAIALWIPYFVFSIITWTLKTVFSSSVNSEVDGIFTALFFDPISPYWYLYALFFVFLITPCFRNKVMGIVILSASLVMKVLTFLPFESDIFLLNTVLQNEIWFVGGMCMSTFNLPDIIRTKKLMPIACTVSAVFVGISVLLCVYEVENSFVSFVMGVAACAATVILAVKYENNRGVLKITDVCTKYTFPVFLMHTIFAAGLRAVLLKLGVHSPLIHMVLGFAVSFIGPVISAMIMSRFNWMEFVLYPNKFFKFKRKTAGEDNGKET